MKLLIRKLGITLLCSLGKIHEGIKLGCLVYTSKSDIHYFNTASRGMGVKSHWTAGLVVNLGLIRFLFIINPTAKQIGRK